MSNIKSAWSKYIEGADGAIVAGASVTVYYETTGSLATIYSDRSGTAESNPVTSDSNGLATFYADSGVYKIVATSGAFTSTLRYISIGESSQTDKMVTSAAAPLAGDDINDGYLIGQIWQDTSVSPIDYYLCEDNAAGAAVWLPMYINTSPDSIITLTGVASGAENLGAFTGSAIDDNKTIKGAFQDLEDHIDNITAGITVSSGTWTPTVSNTVNLDSTTVRAGHYIRVGDIVTVSGIISVNATAGSGTLTSFEIDLPVASNLGIYNGEGTVSTDWSTTPESGVVLGVDSTDTLGLYYATNHTGNANVHFVATYKII